MDEALQISIGGTTYNVRIRQGVPEFVAASALCPADDEIFSEVIAAWRAKYGASLYDPDAYSDRAPKELAGAMEWGSG